jgi:hypothetical protein
MNEKAFRWSLYIWGWQCFSSHSFQSLIVDEATKDNNPPSLSTELRCRRTKCKGDIEVAFDGAVIEWWCTVCNQAGRINDWQGSKWDNSK